MPRPPALLPLLLLGAACRSDGPSAAVQRVALTERPVAVATAGDDADPTCAPPSDVDSDGWDDAAAGGRDCDDTDPDVHPRLADLPGDGVDADCDGWDGEPPADPGCVVTGAEVCNGADDDCDGAVDDPWLTRVATEPAVVAVGALLDGGGSAMVVGVEGEGAVDGRLDVYDLDGALVVSIPGTSQSTTFATQLATGRDLTGDGVVDLVVAAPYATVGGVPNLGRVFVFPGPLGPATTLADASILVEGGEIPGPPGGQLALAPDLSGDGVPEVLVGWYRHVVVFSGVPEPTGAAEAPAWGVERAIATVEWNTGGGAWQFATLPDHDGDLLPELVLAMPTVASGAGFVARYDSGALSGALGTAQAAWTVAGPEGAALGDRLVSVDGALWALSAGAPTRVEADGALSALPFTATGLLSAGDQDGDGRSDLLLAGDAVTVVRADPADPVVLSTFASTLVPQSDRGLADPVDLDGDGLADPVGRLPDTALVLASRWLHEAPCNADGDRLSAAQGDCDDHDASVGPRYGREACDGRDNDCDGLVDEEEDAPVDAAAREAGGLGDLDGDGTAELWIATDGGTDGGTVTAWDGERTPSPRFVVTGVRTDLAGIAAGAGDTDGNGFVELLLATPAGPVLLPAGEDGDAAALAATTFRNATAWWTLGPVASAGDTDGDGLDEPLLAVRTPSGALGLALFRDPGPGVVEVTEAAVLLAAPESWDLLHLGATPPGEGGDLDGDGRDDVLVANPRSAYGDGRAYLFFALEAGERSMDDAASLLLFGDPQEGLGRALAFGEDLDGDGREDAAIGGDGGARLLFGGSCPSFDAEKILPAADALVMADPDGDALAELFLLDLDGVDGEVGGGGGGGTGLVYRAAAGGEATAWRSATDGSALGPVLVAVGDVDGTPGSDLLFGESTTSRRLGACP